MTSDTDRDRRLEELACLCDLATLGGSEGETSLNDTLDRAVEILQSALPETVEVSLIGSGGESRDGGPEPLLVETLRTADEEIGRLEIKTVEGAGDGREDLRDSLESFVHLAARQISQALEYRDRFQKLAASEDLFRTTVEVIGEGLSRADLNETFRSANPAAEQIFGVAPGGLVGRNLKEFLDAEALEIVAAQNLRREQGETSVYELTITTDEGQRKLLLVTATPDVNEAGERIGTVGIYRDVTQRRHVQKRLEESEARFKTLFDNAPISLWEEDLSRIRLFLDTLVEDGVSDLRGYFSDHPDAVVHCAEIVTIVDVNRATLQLFHASDKEAIRSNIDTLFVEDSLDVFAEEILALNEGRSSFTGEIVARTLDGKLKDCELTVAVAPGYEENWGKVFISIADLSERKKKETALRESEALFRRTFDQAPVGAAMVALNGTFLRVNTRFCEILGYSEEELLGANYVDITHPGDRSRSTASVEGLASGETEQIHMDKRYIRKDGEVVWGRLSVQVIRDAAGTPLYYLPMVEDVTEHLRVVEDLRASRERYAQAQRAANIGSWNWNVESGELSWSENIDGILGVGPGEFGRTFDAFLDRVPADDSDIVRDAVRLALDEEEDREFRAEHRILWPDGSERWLAEAGDIRRDDQGRATHVYGIVQDVTERKRAVAELVEAKEIAEAANRTKSDFLAHMSHEIRTPLNAILGMTDLTLESPLNQQQADFLQTAKASAEHLLAIVNDILDLSKVEAGKIDLEERVFSLRRLLEELLTVMRPRASETELQLELRVDATVPDTLRGDPGRLRQVLYNLIHNAIKFTKEGSIELVVASMGTTENTATLRFAVSDTGIGIPEEKLEAIFDPFAQADGTTTRLFGGTGLGLAISRNLVELMGGELWVDSAEGEGSTFRFTATFTLAQVEKGIATPAEEVETSTGVGHLRILLAEDFPASQKVAVAMLEMRGYEVVVADNGQQAVEEFQQKAFDLILMDVEMPVMDGVEATRAIRAIEAERGGRTPILALTAHAMKGIEERLKEAGMNSVLTKPVRKVWLYEAIDRVMEEAAASRTP